ncbi:thiol-disulfide isomerase [Flexivirga endophytica]|uniref:Thiol-disulfide isomerase n=1 Tax=Flexivirga endophytica TaxID=1849103 RepID=A0A916TGF5_9MICO|nr:TlpA disulfide reductase family protein [Flexivirga endophytica]GGB42727.1 thiol-disulfide isomerase [Flexivirga endophytica]GHB64216.1 thiol-disulfide isomerase [Flexivirga endophytica]
MTLRRAVPAVTLACVAALGLAACGSDGGKSISDQANQGSDKNYLSGDGTLAQLSPGERGKPVTLSGKLLDGTPWSTKDHPGKVIIVNVWGSWCPPCKAETPDLQKAWEKLQKKGVLMVGVDRQEGPQTAAAYLKSAGVTYPSLRDDGGAALVALQGKASATPSTLVLDSEHRIAARVSGPTTTSTLTGLVNDVLSKG